MGRPVGSFGRQRGRDFAETFDALEHDGRISKQTLALKLWDMAMAGDATAMREVADRWFGRPTVSVDHGGEVTSRHYVAHVPEPTSREAWLAKYAEQQALAAEIPDGDVN